MGSNRAWIKNKLGIKKVILLLLTCGVLISSFFLMKQKNQSNTDKLIPQIRVVSTTRKEFVQKIRIPSYTQANAEVGVRSRVDGQILSIHFKIINIQISIYLI
jgi:multidrug efflux pump subunit AcrA (membrane-fusion protein)